MKIWRTLLGHQSVLYCVPFNAVFMVILYCCDSLYHQEHVVTYLENVNNLLKIHKLEQRVFCIVCTIVRNVLLHLLVPLQV